MQNDCALLWYIVVLKEGVTNSIEVDENVCVLSHATGSRSHHAHTCRIHHPIIEWYMLLNGASASVDCAIDIVEVLLFHQNIIASCCTTAGWSNAAGNI
jgi:hypothetical protein